MRLPILVNKCRLPFRLRRQCGGNALLCLCEVHTPRSWIWSWGRANNKLNEWMLIHCEREWMNGIVGWRIFIQLSDLANVWKETQNVNFWSHRERKINWGHFACKSCTFSMTLLVVGEKKLQSGKQWRQPELVKPVRRRAAAACCLCEKNPRERVEKFFLLTSIDNNSISNRDKSNIEQIRLVLLKACNFCHWPH